MATETVNINHEGYDRRLVVVNDILKRYNLKPAKIVPLAYSDNIRYAYNNFLYRVDLASPATAANFTSPSSSPQPGTAPPASPGAPTIVVRLSNPFAGGVNNANRVENEVACISLARAALGRARPELARIVPNVYAWQAIRWPEVAGEPGFGFVIEEFLPGRNLRAEMREMEWKEKIGVIDQAAEIFAALQGAEIPDTVKQFGALTFDASGRIVSGQAALLEGGPWSEYADVWNAKFRIQLARAEDSSLLQGWRPNGVKERVENYLAGNGVMEMLKGVDVDEKALIHGDFTTINMLYDADTKRITGLLDFDWAGISHPCEEFLSSLTDLQGSTYPDNKEIQAAVLTGNFDSIPEDIDSQERLEWETAKAWDDALKARGAIRPSSIRGIEQLEQLREVDYLLCPWSLLDPVLLERVPRDKLDSRREHNEEKICKLLEACGF